ncbi:MAG: hypothetical protein J7K47_00480, partial [Thermoplasmata archaeon]|nr:hypothetical protein [Thermoplasmata archaeon]
YFKQLYEIKFLVEALDAKIEHIDIQRKYSYMAKYSNLKVDDRIIYDALDQIQITFGRPNIIIKRKNRDYYTIWYEFSFTKYLRPDYFILKGKQDSPFNESVYEYLRTIDDDFWKKIINEWKDGLHRVSLGSDDSFSSGPSTSEIEQFLLGLVEHLKKGLILESKESESDFKSTNTFRQLELYPKIFNNQKLVLLSWKKVPIHISGFEIIEDFENDENARNKLVELIVNM